MAGGFMSGFGSAFAQSFNQASSERSQRENDMFRLQYADYISRRDIEEKRKIEDSKMVKNAKMLAEDAGVPEAWTDIHSRLQSGWDMKSVQDYLEEWEPEVIPITEQATTNVEGAEPDAALSSKAETSVSAQMSESGMPAPESGGIFGNLKEIFSPDAQMARSQERVTNRVAGAADVPREDILATLRPKEVATNPEPLPGKEGMQIKWKKKDPYKWIYDATDQDDAELNLLKAVESGDPKAVAIAKKAVQAFQKPVDWWTKERDQAMINLERAQAMGDQQGIEISNRILQTLDEFQMQEQERELNQPVNPATTTDPAGMIAGEQQAINQGDFDRAEQFARNRELIQQDEISRAQQMEKVKEKPFDYLAEKDPALARNNLIRAELSGNPEEINLAKRVYENTVVEKELGTIREMKAQGKYFQSNLGLLPTERGNKTVVNRNGVWVDMVTEEPVDEQNNVRPWTEDEEKRMTEIIQKSAEPARAYNEKAVAYVQSIRDTQDMIELRERYPEAATTAGQAAAMANSGLRSLQGFWNLATQEANTERFNEGTLNKLTQFEDQLEANLKSVVSGNIVDNTRTLGLAYALMNTKAIRAAYTQAKAIGAGTGQGLGQKEYERIYNTFMNSDSKAFVQDRQDYIINQHAALKQEAESFNQFDPLAQWFKTNMDLVSLPVSPIQDIDEYIGMDGKVQSFFNRVKDNAIATNPEIANPDQIQTSEPIPEGLVLTPEEKTLWDSLSPRGRELLKKSKEKK